MTKPKLAMIGAVALVAITIHASTFTVRAGQVAFVLAFGGIKGDAITAPGLHWKWPYVEEVRRLDTRLETWSSGTIDIPTLGREFVLVDTTARWHITNPRLFLEANEGERAVRDRLDAVLTAVVRDAVGRARLEELIRSSDGRGAPPGASRDAGALAQPDDPRNAGWGRQALEQRIYQGARPLVAAYGMGLVDVNIKRVSYAPSVRPQVEGRMIAERQSVAEGVRSEGRGRREEILGDLQKEVQEIRSAAVRKSDEIRGTTDAEVTRIYGETYSRDPEFYAFLKSLDTYRRAMGDNTTLMVGTDSEFYRYLGTAKKKQ